MQWVTLNQLQMQIELLHFELISWQFARAHSAYTRCQALPRLNIYNSIWNKHCDNEPTVRTAFLHPHSIKYSGLCKHVNARGGRGKGRVLGGSSNMQNGLLVCLPDWLPSCLLFALPLAWLDLSCLECCNDQLQVQIMKQMRGGEGRLSWQCSLLVLRCFFLLMASSFASVANDELSLRWQSTVHIRAALSYKRVQRSVQCSAV